MSRPRIFVSSTYYDLRHVRSSLEDFINSLGYEPVLSEKGRIAYDPDIPLDESCYREAASTDIFVLIVGGRYGTAASDEGLKNKPEFYERYESITKKEYLAAINRDIPTYILVERQVFSEFETYKKNKGNDTIKYAHVDSVNVFHFLEDILSRSHNNPMLQFDRHTEIEEWLREQWAGLFRELITRKSEQKQLSSLSEKIEELSSISTSLERYMEAVVSSVSKSSEEADKLIQTENERRESDKKFREFVKIKIVQETIEEYGLTPELVADIFRRATSLDDLALIVEKETEGQVDAEGAIVHWLENANIVNGINKARELLGTTPLDFIEAQ